jgi:hypothetical protein
MNIERVNYVLERAILELQDDEIENLLEKAAFKVMSPAQMSKKHGMILPDEPLPKKKRAPRKKKPKAPVTVDFWYKYLGHKLTRYDMAETKREMKRSGRSNIYRLGHLLKALGKVKDDINSIRDQEGAEALEKFRKSMNSRFHSTFAPIRAVNKAVDKFLSTGKRPQIK